MPISSLRSCATSTFPPPSEGNAATTIRLYSVDRVPALSSILPALHNAGVAIEREAAHTIRTADGKKHFITSLAVDAQSATELARPGVVEVAQELFNALFNNEAEDGRLNGLVVEGGLSLREVQLVRSYMSYWRQGGSQFTVRYMAETLRRHPALVKELVDAWKERFDPKLPEATRNAAKDKLLAALTGSLSKSSH